jgi:hypothetical protein
MRNAAMCVVFGLAMVGCGFDDSASTGPNGVSTTGAGGESTTGAGGDIGTAGDRPSTSGSGGDNGNAGTNGGTGGSNGESGSVTSDASVNPGIPEAGSLPDIPARDVYIVDRPPNAPGILIHVENRCPFDIWIHGAGNGAVLQPDNAQIKVNEFRDYTAPDTWPAARVTASSAGTPGNELDKVEMTLGNKIINYNVTYVDWVGLPVEMVSIGTGADCKRVGCYLPEAQILTGCPDGLLSGKRCLSAGSYCGSAANQAKPYCHALDAKIAQCAGNAGGKYPGCGNGSTPQVYGCSGFFGGSPKWCAALNRGMIDDPDNGNIALYYQNAPYNTYAKWVHSVCPGIYAFPYDDYGKTNESGFHACSGGRQLNITFCPAG